MIDGVGGEIVHARWKRRENVNPLVPGSSPGGPTKQVEFGDTCHCRWDIDQLDADPDLT